MIIIKVSTRRNKPQRKVASAPRSVKVVKTKVSEETPVETKPQTSRIVRQIRNVRPLTPATALFAWNSLFQTGVA